MPADHQALLAPIPGADAVGEDLLFSAEYDAIKEARRADDPSLDQGEWVTELKTADWPGVASQCAKLLQQRSKDLQLAVWWTEAQTRLQGFSGLSQGYRLVAGLCDAYWERVYPQAEDGDQEQRIGVLSWLLGHSAQWLRTLPIVQSPHGRYGLGDFEAARTRREPHDGVNLETLEASRKATSHEFYMRLVDAVAEARDALSILERAVDARLGHDGPSFAALREQMEHLGDVVRRFAREAGVLMESPALVAGAATDDLLAPLPAVEPQGPMLPAAHAKGAAPAPSGPGAIGSRREAIAQLRRVAEFFRQTEPHSPVAYLADKAARWGEMPLHVWLRRVVKDDSTLARLEDLLDLEAADDGASGH